MMAARPNPDLEGALYVERAYLLSHRVDLAMLNLDVRCAALKSMFGRTQMVERRSVQQAATGVDTEARIITVIAVPYNQPAEVMWRAQTWTEVVEPGAFEGIDESGGKVRVNRGHDKFRTVGKVVRFDAGHPSGLLAEIRVAQTPLGDETLALAAEDMLSASIGFWVPAGGERLDRATRTRRITSARLDHLSLVESPAYPGAQVVGVA